MRCSRSLLCLSVILFLCASSPAWSQERPPARQQQVKFAEVLKKAKAALENGHKPNEVRPFEPTELEKKIHAAMDDQTAVNFIDAPLTEACQFISKTHDIPVLVDARALEEIGLTPDVPVTISLKGTKLRSALRLILKDLDLTYRIDDEVLQICTIESAEWNLSSYMFKLPPKLAARKREVIVAVKANVVPDTWEELGGPSVAMLVGDVLVISATDDVSEQVGEFLSKLTKALSK